MLDPGSVDLTFADPPFNIGYDYDVYDDRQERDAYLDWSRKWIDAVHTALKPTGTFWLAIGDEYAAELKLLSQEVGFHCRSWVVWYYTFGVNCKQKFSRSHAHLFHFVKNEKDFTFNTESIRVPSARQLDLQRHSRQSQGTLAPTTPGSSALRTAPTVSQPTRTPGTSPASPERSRNGPASTAARCPNNSSDGSSAPARIPKNSCSTPFPAVATTLAVAKKLGRHYLGFDLSQDYAAHGRARLEEITTGDPLDGAPRTPHQRPRHAGWPSAKKDEVDRAFRFASPCTRWTDPVRRVSRHRDWRMRASGCVHVTAAFTLSIARSHKSRAVSACGASAITRSTAPCCWPGPGPSGPASPGGGRRLRSVGVCELTLQRFAGRVDSLFRALNLLFDDRVGRQF